MGRPFCYRCHRAQEHCLCELITPIHNKLPVYILQHFRERFHPIGTARIAKLSLKNCHITVAHSGFPSQSQGKDGPKRVIDETDLHTPMQLPGGTVVLYPSKQAKPIEDVERPNALLVLDATWSHSRRIYYENPWIQELPHIALSPTEPSRYLIRKEPAFHCISTLEAIAEALKVWEPELDLSPAIDVFDAMIAKQARYCPPVTD